MMKVYECPDQEVVLLKNNHINIVYQKKATLQLEDPEENACVKIMFMEQGDFKIESLNSEISFGKSSAKIVETRPGECHFNTQPSFIYLHKIKKWIYNSDQSWECLIFPEKE